jgi:hypothetical protein
LIASLAKDLHLLIITDGEDTESPPPYTGIGGMAPMVNWLNDKGYGGEIHLLAVGNEISVPIGGVERVGWGSALASSLLHFFLQVSSSLVRSFLLSSLLSLSAASLKKGATEQASVSGKKKKVHAGKRLAPIEGKMRRLREEANG